MSAMYPNNLYRQLASDKVCTTLWAFGIRLVASPAIVQLAKIAGFNSLFIDLEHSTLSLENAGALCTTALAAGVTPFVRVPHQCGNGFIQRVLDAGAMGAIIPHIHSREDAEAAVRICKYPPLGVRSMTGQLPVFALTTQHPDVVITETNANGSTVMLMIETRDAIDSIDDIVRVPGVDVLLIGSNDLSIELGIPGQFDDPIFRSALQKVGQAARKYEKIFGLAGIYDRKEFHDYAINELGARFILGQQDSGVLAGGIKACADVFGQVQTISR